MNRTKVLQHYKDFFDLHAKGIELDEEDQLNIDWAIALIEDINGTQANGSDKSTEPALRINNVIARFNDEEIKELLKQERVKLMRGLIEDWSGSWDDAGHISGLEERIDIELNGL